MGITPNHLPIILARKPLSEKTVAANVLKWGTGALNIDAARVPTANEAFHVPQSNPENRKGVVGSDLGITNTDADKFQAAQKASIERTAALGRWPANVCHDGSDEVVSMFPSAKGGSSNGDAKVGEPSAGVVPPIRRGKLIPRNDEGSAARFFYNTNNEEETLQDFYNGKIELHHGDSTKVLKEFPDNHFDSIVCDPPYHLTSIVKRFGKDGAAPAQFGSDGAFARASKGFMGKEWDGGDLAFQPEFWYEVGRVLKPGGHLVAFAASRNYHRMACAIEDAGFEIRDQIMWLYGTGFPKSHDVAQNIEKLETTGKARREGRELNLPRNRFSGSVEGTLISNTGGKVPLTTEAAKQWQGYGTALKPSHEPLVLARKPLSEKTVAANVLKHGTGALNIDATRVPTSTNDDIHAKNPHTKGGFGHGDAAIYGTSDGAPAYDPAKGRWPANICHDGSEEVVSMFPRQGAHSPTGPYSYCDSEYDVKGFINKIKPNAPSNYGDEGSAARFYYSAKANKEDRAGSSHPTVKPVKLMEWLVKMVTPKGGTLLDPFAGSGTTGQAALNCGMKAVLIEREDEYVEDIKRRFSKINLDQFT